MLPIRHNCLYFPCRLSLIFQQSTLLMICDILGSPVTKCTATRANLTHPSLSWPFMALVFQRPILPQGHVVSDGLSAGSRKPILLNPLWSSNATSVSLLLRNIYRMIYIAFRNQCTHFCCPQSRNDDMMF